ncbi:MAG: ABC transporter ATP-binding protein/permease [bacterium]
MKDTIKQFKTIFKLIKIAYKINKKYFFVILTTLILNSVLPLISAYSFSRLLEIAAGITSTSIEGTVIIIIVFYLSAQFLMGACGEIFHNVAYFGYPALISKYFTIEAIKKASELDLEFYENPEYSSLKMNALDSYEWRPTETLMHTLTTLQVLFSAVLAGISIIFVLPFQSILIIISIIPGILIDFKFRKGEWNIWSSNTNIRKKYGALLWMNTSQNYFKEIKLLNLSTFFRNEMNNLITTIYSKEKTNQFKRSFYIILTSLLPIFVLGYVVWELIRNTQSGIISITILSFYIMTLVRFKSDFSQTLMEMNNSVITAKYVGVIFEYLEIKPKIITNSNAIKNIKNPPSIEFRNVTFQYPGTSIDILKNFNLKIESGQKIALVGENGAGKTTLIKLLLRFYDVTSGEVLVNGINIKDIDLSEWRKMCGVLMQDFILFEYPTITENIGFGNRDKYINQINETTFVNDVKKDGVPDEVLAASIKACSHDFIMKNTKGYNEIFGREYEGVDFSGGETQRIALARTFYKDAGLIIMDEPTSAVDAKAESEIFESIKEHLQDKTVIFVSHRFSTFKIADRIVVLQDGQIIEDGKHEDLIVNDGLYSTMFNLQAKGYK